MYCFYVSFLPLAWRGAEMVRVHSCFSWLGQSAPCLGELLCELCVLERSFYYLKEGSGESLAQTAVKLCSRRFLPTWAESRRVFQYSVG